MSNKPKLMLKLGTSLPKQPPPSTPNASATTPSGSAGGFKIRLKTGASKPNTPIEEPSKPPAPAPIKKTKAGRTTKPSAKLKEANKNGKRVKDDSDPDSDEDGGMPLAQVKPKAKKLKISLGAAGAATPKISLKTGNTAPPKVTNIRAKFKGKPPKRTLGEGYDSEASDREIDPLIEEEFVLRMMPGDDCDYLREAIQDHKIGVPRAQGGADVQMKFYHGEGRRASVTIRGHIYAATLVDLPTVIEGMKSWDRRGWWKSADICQMLLVFARVPDEETAKTIDLPRTVDPKTYQFPHGLTPPMHYARKRRFRRRISRNAIEAVEEAVEKLLADDAAAQSTKYEIVDPDAESRRGSYAYSEGDSEGGYGDETFEDEDAEGEEDVGYFDQQNDNANMEEDLEADLEADLMNALQDEEEAAASAAATPSAVVETPAEVEELFGSEADPDDSGDESSDTAGGSDDGAGAGDDMDEDERARREQLQGLREDIADMTRQIGVLEGQLASQSNPLLQKRIRDNIAKVKAERDLKMSAIGETEED